MTSAKTNAWMETLASATPSWLRESEPAREALDDLKEKALNQGRVLDGRRLVRLLTILNLGEEYARSSRREGGRSRFQKDVLKLGRALSRVAVAITGLGRSEAALFAFDEIDAVHKAVLAAIDPVAGLLQCAQGDTWRDRLQATIVREVYVATGRYHHSDVAELIWAARQVRSHPVASARARLDHRALATHRRDRRRAIDVHRKWFKRNRHFVHRDAVLARAAHIRALDLALRRATSAPFAANSETLDSSSQADRSDEVVARFQRINELIEKTQKSLNDPRPRKT